jgi:hypothetical protein
MSVRWEVFENPGEAGEWLSYIENDTNYLGGERHSTKAAAEAYGRKIAAEYNDGKRPLPPPPGPGPLLFIFIEPPEVKP